MKRRKFIEWCGAALAALVVPVRSAFAVRAPRPVTVTTHMPQESIDKINVFMAEARANGGFKPIVFDEPFEEVPPEVLKKAVDEWVDNTKRAQRLPVWERSDMEREFMRAQELQELSRALNTPPLPPGSRVVPFPKITFEPDNIKMWKPKMKTPAEMEASIPLCKNCGGHFTRDHTHIFHGEDICDKYMDPLTGRMSRWSRYEAKRCR